MAASRSSQTRAAIHARSEILTALKDDHKRVKKAFRDFKKLDVHEDPARCEAIVKQVLDELTVHAALEEELLYPAARESLADNDLIDEAEVEHETLHGLIDQLRRLSPVEDKYGARFTVLCEYVLHHVKEEEGEMFPKLEAAQFDWEGLAAEMGERRAELTGTDAEAGDTRHPAAAAMQRGRASPAPSRARA
ncbi:MAG TPA: hemerythrin domain-containing protein [Roseateles sp.]